MLLDKDFVMQGGVRNYLGKTEEVKAPKYWKSSKDSPSTELAYITEAEKGLLLDANLHGSLKNGKPNVGASGLLSYDGFGSTDSGQNRSGGDVSSSMDRGGNDGNDRMGSSSGGGASFQGTSPNPTSPPGVTNKSNNVGDGEDIDSIYTDDSFKTNPTDNKSFLSQVFDFVKGGGITGAVLKSIGGKLNPENKYEGITGEDGYGEGDYISTQGDWAASKGYVDESAEYYALDLEEQQNIDKLMFDDGVRSQAFNDLYTEGDTSNLNNLTSTERSEISKIIPNMAYDIGGTQQQPSMVNQYFANMGSNLGVSSAYMDTYNAAKDKISQSLNLTPNNQQYGYGNTFNDNYSRSMTSANPFFDELTNQGLI